MPKKLDDVFGFQEVKEQRVSLFRALIAEFVGTLLLVFFGCGAANAAATGLPDRDNTVGKGKVGLPPSFITMVSLTFGLVVASVAQVRFFQ